MCLFCSWDCWYGCRRRRRHDVRLQDQEGHVQNCGTTLQGTASQAYGNAAQYQPQLCQMYHSKSWKEGTIMPTLKIFWFAVYCLTHHFTHAAIIFFAHFKDFFFFLLLFIYSLKYFSWVNKFSYLPTQPENSGSLNRKQKDFKVGLNLTIFTVINFHISPVLDNVKK